MLRKHLCRLRSALGAQTSPWLKCSPVSVPSAYRMRNQTGAVIAAVVAFVAMRAFTRRLYGKRTLLRQTSSAPRLPPQVPPFQDAKQQELYDTIVDTRIKVIGKDALFDERGALRGPWNPEVASPLLGRHLERLATSVRTENSLEANVYEVAILAVGVAWHATERRRDKMAPLTLKGEAQRGWTGDPGGSERWL